MSCFLLLTKSIHNHSLDSFFPKFHLKTVAALVDEFAPVLKSITLKVFLLSTKKSSDDVTNYVHCQAIVKLGGPLERLNLLKKLSQDLRFLKLLEILFLLCSLTVKKTSFM